MPQNHFKRLCFRMFIKMLHKVRLTFTYKTRTHMKHLISQYTIIFTKRMKQKILVTTMIMLAMYHSNSVQRRRITKHSKCHHRTIHTQRLLRTRLNTVYTEMGKKINTTLYLKIKDHSPKNRERRLALSDMKSILELLLFKNYHVAIISCQQTLIPNE